MTVSVVKSVAETQQVVHHICRTERTTHRLGRLCPVRVSIPGGMPFAERTRFQPRRAAACTLLRIAFPVPPYREGWERNASGAKGRHRIRAAIMGCLVKRSQALRRRNLARDSRADGASGSGATSSHHSDTGAMPQKIPGSGAEPQRSAIHAPTPQKTAN